MARYAHGCETNLLGIITGQDGVLILKMVRQATIKAEAFGHLFIMVALVL
jgi:hypothetical protein